MKILADNSAISIKLNGTTIGAQTDAIDPVNFNTVSEFNYATTATFAAGTNTLTIQNKDYGVADGIDFKATIAYDPAPLAISFSTPASKTYDGTTAADIMGCSVAPTAAGLSCAPATGAHAVFSSKNVGTRSVTAATDAFTLSGPLLSEYTQVSVDPTTADITKRAVTVSAVADDKVADDTRDSAKLPVITVGDLASGDTAVFVQTFAKKQADFPIALTPSVVSVQDSGAADMSGNYAFTLVPDTGRIRPGPAASLAFNRQPIDTLVSTPIYNTCVPAASGTNPCAVAPTSSPVQVTAKDQYDNLAGPGAPGADAGTADISIAINKDTSGGTSLGSALTSNGVASFGDGLVIGSTGSTNLFASTSTGTPATSTPFTIVSGLKACQGTSCENQALDPNARAYGKITTSSNFYVPGTANVLLTTQFLPGSAIDGQCGNGQGTTLGSGVELKVQGLGTSATAPSSTMLIIIPKAVLKAAHKDDKSASSFNVCLGALWIGAGSPTSPTAPWLGKNAKGVLIPATSGGTSDPNRYWGTPTMCGTRGLRASDPCVSLKTKEDSDVARKLGWTKAQVAAIFKEDDLAIFITKPTPWDGKGGVY